MSVPTRSDLVCEDPAGYNVAQWWGAPPPAPATALGNLKLLAKNNALRSSPFHLGTMSVGTAWGEFMGSMDKEQSFALFDAFVAAGGNTFDSASGYQFGQSEGWLGDWMAERGNRDQCVIATKFTQDYSSWKDGKGTVANRSGNGKKGMVLSVRDSLIKLRTDYIDIYYLHFWDYTASIPEIMDALHLLVTSGKVLYLGVSDVPAWIVTACNNYAIQHGKTPFTIYQGRWNLAARDVEREILPMCSHFGMAFASWDSIGGGRWQSKKQLAARAQAGENLRASMTSTAQGLSAEEAAISEALEEVGKEHGTDNIQSVALAWILAKAKFYGVNVFPIVGGRKITHLTSNIEALSIELTKEQVAKLDNVKAFEFGFPYSLIGSNPNLEGMFPKSRVSSTAHLKFPLPFNP